MYCLKLTVLILRHLCFIIFDLFVIFYKTIGISYAGRLQSTLDWSLFFISPSSEMCEAGKQRLMSLCDLTPTIRGGGLWIFSGITLGYIQNMDHPCGPSPRTPMGPGPWNGLVDHP